MHLAIVWADGSQPAESNHESPGRESVDEEQTTTVIAKPRTTSRPSIHTSDRCAGSRSANRRANEHMASYACKHAQRLHQVSVSSRSVDDDVCAR
jgi:hypothetical protein